jgi:uncharacterized protein (TIGR02246 family)
MTGEDRIREVLQRWRRATADGNVAQLLPLMAEDVVFLSAGQPALRGRDAFEAHLRAALTAVHLKPTAELQEIAVAGNFAYCWNDVALEVTPRGAASGFRLVGADLTILRREPDGRRVVFRAASMLVPEQSAGP